LFAGRLAINADLFSLMKNRIQINSVTLEDFKANVRRSPDGTFNFDYIISAFAGDTTAVEDTTGGWDFALYDVNLHRLNISLLDSLEGNYITVNMGTLEIETDEFNLNESII